MHSMDIKLMLTGKLEIMDENCYTDERGILATWISVGTIGAFFFISGFITRLNDILIPIIMKKVKNLGMFLFQVLMILILEDVLGVKLKSRYPYTNGYIVVNNKQLKDKVLDMPHQVWGNSPMFNPPPQRNWLIYGMSMCEGMANIIRAVHPLLDRIPDIPPLLLTGLAKGKRSTSPGIFLVLIRCEIIGI